MGCLWFYRLLAVRRLCSHDSYASSVGTIQSVCCRLSCQELRNGPARQVADETERLLLGTSVVADQYSFGGGKIYGMTDHPDRLLKTMTNPTESGWTPKTFLTEVQAMIEQARLAFHYGPLTLYVAGVWSQYLGQDYVDDYPKTLRSRVMELEEIDEIQVLDYLNNTNYDVVLVQKTSDVGRLVIGMDITTVMWDTMGGLQKNFKIMSIIVP